MVVKMTEENGESSSVSYRSQQHNPHSAESTPVSLDHCYAKPWNWRQEMAHCRPVRILFAEDKLSLRDEDFVDIEENTPLYKPHAMINCEKTSQNYFDSQTKLHSLSAEETSDEWEEAVRREGWTPLQHRIFNKVVKLLVADKMARLATERHENEAIHKKIHADGSSKKLRIILSSVAWDIKITQWLHLTLIEHLNRDYLMGYIGILQVLRNKVPTLVDRILNTPLLNTKLAAVNAEIIDYVMNKPWQPVLMGNQPAIARLQTVPFFIMVPSGTNNYNDSDLTGSKRFQAWQNLLQTVGRVITISLPSVTSPHSLPLPMFVEAVINATVQRIQDLKAGCPDRPIVLIGLQQGALIAAQAAYLEPVTALICLGFPLFSVDGKRGEPDDFVLDIRAPTMFVIGKNATTTSVDGMEQMRHRMKAESSLLVVDGAVDSLRLLKWKKKQQSITQAAVDACILDEMSTFLMSALSRGIATGKRSPVERKPDALSAAQAGSIKRPRHSNDSEDSPHPALSGHNYSQNTPFVQPWKGRGGTGLVRVRGGRVGPSSSSSRSSYQRTLSDAGQSTPRGRIGRSLSTARPGDSLPSRGVPVHRGQLSARSPSSHLDADMDCKSSVGSSQGSPKDDGAPPPECKGGGDSSETESAPPADDDEEIMEDLRFCNEFMNKQQQQNPSAKHGDSTTEDEHHIKSGDEAEVCRRLNAENRNRTKRYRPPP